MRLDKFLGLMGVGTRKQIKEYVKNGRCQVNGIVVSKADIHVDENKDVISFDGNELGYSKYHYFMLYKPQGVVSATTDGRNTTVLDLLADENVKGLSPAGRLDIDTEGLLLLTDDGGLIHRLLSPKKHVDKVYEVHLASSLSEEDIDKLQKGLDIGDKKDNGDIDYTLPAKVIDKGLDKENRPVVHLIIHEGRFHQVKRMMEAVDNEVLFLKRLSMGPLVLDENLIPGEYRKLTDEELSALGVK
ncbi:pseudouridine synthase [Butyrivibrio sp. INlla14]|uniref:pseudouridine synthase n=1 Tax=Butyrivibrio sp. INlla14 TaxID=1520808 RepID=UPI0008762C9B|nr:pseudouridine synthase [Butyrivibrio sp. INlla14]SCY67412.1 16S rRNA pseudouridine516 synthase [Butyrivibrio sp. INlla14]